MEHKMFVAVLAATLFMLTAATGGSAADSCTASLPPLVGGGGECYVMSITSHMYAHTSWADIYSL